MDEQLEVLLTREEIQEKVKEIANMISDDYKGKEVLLVCVLKGGVVFLSDLMRYLSISTEIDFIAVSSYGISTKSSGVVKIIKDLDTSIEDMHVIIVEDIIDTGLTLRYLLENLRTRLPASLKVCALLDKPERRLLEINADYSGFAIPDKFVVGYGLDYSEKYRNLPDICILDGE